MYEVNAMGYRVTYGGPEQGKIGLAGATAVWLVVFFLLVGLFWPEGTQALRDILIPGDPSVTTAALEQFAGELRSGSAWREALEALGRRVAAG